MNDKKCDNCRNLWADMEKCDHCGVDSAMYEKDEQSPPGRASHGVVLERLVMPHTEG